MIFKGFWVEASWLKKKTTVTSASQTDQQMKGAHHKQFRCPPFDLLNFTQNKEAHKRTEETPSFWRRHTMFKLWQKSKDQTGQLIHTIHCHSIFPNTSLSSKVIARPCWEKDLKSEVIDVVLVILKRRRALTSCELITISCSNVRGGFPVDELFWFWLVQVSTTRFVVSHLFSWRVLAMAKRAYISFTSYFEFRFSWWFRPWSRRNGMAHHSYDAQFKEVRDILLPLVQGFKDLDKHSRPFGRPWVLSPP